MRRGGWRGGGVEGRKTLIVEGWKAGGAGVLRVGAAGAPAGDAVPAN